MGLTKDQYFDELKKREKKWKLRNARNGSKNKYKEENACLTLLRIKKEKNPRNIM